jgi:hypothetical protein
VIPTLPRYDTLLLCVAGALLAAIGFSALYTEYGRVGAAIGGVVSVGVLAAAEGVQQVRHQVQRTGDPQ